MPPIRRHATTDTTATTAATTTTTSIRRIPSPPGTGIRSIIKRHNDSRPGAYPEFKPNDTERVVQFLEPDAIVGMYSHWVDAAPKRKSWLCLDNPSDEYFVGADPDDDRGCPLCKCPPDAGIKRSFKAFFNLVELLDWDQNRPTVSVMETGITLARYISDASEAERTSPINRPDLAFIIQRTSTGEGNSKKYDYKLPPVKARDLAEDFPGRNLVALTEEQRASLTDKLYDRSIVKLDTYEDLAALVDELYG